MALLHDSILFLTLLALPGSYSSRVTLTNNGYDDVVVAINPAVPEDPQLIESLKSVFSEASESLFEATKHRVYFRSIKILVPDTWTNGTYASATHDTYNSADVLVAESNPAFGHVPYTLQYGGCGLPGQYIHVTPDYIKLSKYILDTGRKGKTLTHEWAHLRWGVFDEAPTPGYPKFYLQNSKVEATRCPASLDGALLDINIFTGTVGFCSLDQQTYLPQSSCYFVPYNQQLSSLSASLMSHQYVNEVSTFCHSDPSDPVNLHNTAAPNEQNRLCNLRSTWDVILDSDDFKNGSNPSNSSIDTTPIITVVKTQPPKYVLVMDVSGSMGGVRIDALKRAAISFVVDYVSDSSLVGLVKFSSSATKLRDLSFMDATDREDFKDEISLLRAGGGTNIGNGIDTGLEVLKGSGQEYSCSGSLIVLTDGQGTLGDAYDNVMSCGARMHSIFLDQTSATANKIMTDISVDSGGSWFLATSNSDSADIISIFQTLSQTDNGNNEDTSYQIHSSSFSATENATGTVNIDSTVGKKTLFTFTYGSYQPTKILLRSPAGCDYSTETSIANACPDGSIHVWDTSLKTCKFSVPRVAARGDWIYIVSNEGGSQDITVTVTSKPSRANVAPIIVETFLSFTDVSSRTATVIFAKVSQGFIPVTDARVTAFITAPDGNEKSIRLRDNGAAPDVRRDDGVYSRYYFKFTQQGRYSLRIRVKGVYGFVQYGSAGSPAAFNAGTVLENGTFVENPNGLNNLANDTSTNNTAVAENFERVTSGGSISYTGPAVSDTDVSDVFEPSQISDLSTTQANVSNLEEAILVEITFTAPGDDFDEGNADAYEIRYALENATKLLEDFDSATLVSQNDVVEGNLSHPQEASSAEKFVFKISNLPGNSSKIFVAAKAYDEVNQTSGVSNVSPVTLILKRSALPPPATSEVSTLASTDGTTTFTTSKKQDSIDTIPGSSDEPLLLYQIAVGVLGFVAIILAVTVVHLCMKLRSRPKKATASGNGNNDIYENPYA